MTQTDFSPDPDLLDRFLANEVTEDEAKLVRRWLAGNPDEDLRLKMIHAGLAEQGGELPMYNSEARVASVVDYSMRLARRSRKQSELRHVPPNDFSSDEGRPGTYPSLSRKVWYGASAVIAACLLIFFGATFKGAGSGGVGGGRGEAGIKSVYTYTTENGERKKVMLADGSEVALNVGSRLEVPVDYSDGNRRLKLSGEAVFLVKSSSASPFIVEAGSTLTKVLGTEFGVRHYPDDTITTVAVRDGKVAVNSVVLTESQQAKVTLNGFTHVGTASEARFAFVDNTLIFDGIPLGNAVSELNRWYDIEIHIGDSSLASQELWGTFSGDSIDDLVTILKMTFRVDVVREGKSLTLNPGK